MKHSGNHAAHAPILKLDSVTFDDLLARQNPFYNAACIFDLTGVRFITPSALVQLAAACHALARLRRQPTIIVNDESVRSYLMRSGFIQAVRPICEFSPRIPPLRTLVYELYRRSNPLLIEVTKIERGTELPDLLDQIVLVLRRRLKYKKNDTFDIATAVSEVCQNTFDHNTHTQGFLAMQVYGSGAERFLEIGVADYGDGLANTLKRNPQNPPIWSDLEAIHQATQLGTSEFSDCTRGTGLFHLLDLIYKNEGTVQIRSGTAKVRYRADKQRGWAFSVAPMPGVQIALSLPTKATA